MFSGFWEAGCPVEPVAEECPTQLIYIRMGESLENKTIESNYEKSCNAFYCYLCDATFWWLSQY